MTGILLVDKPPKWTSFDVVNYVRKIVAQNEDKKPKNVKVGHSGTLDPFATGLLVLLIGKEYTVLAKQYSGFDKTYEVEMKLGQKSSTGDPEGQIETVPGSQPSKAEIEAVLDGFTGVISQIPPAFSAIKIDGVRAYKLARAGQSVNLEPREITIKSLKLIGYEYPFVKLVASVSSGTYIRVLVEDIAKKLGTVAYTTDLRRTEVGQFSLENAMKIDDLNATMINKNIIK